MAIAEMLAKNRVINDLDIGNTELGTESIIALATVLKANNAVQRLNVENPRLHSLGVGLPFRSPHSPWARFSNEPGLSSQEESTHQLASMLQTNTTLTELNIAKHKVRDEGARVLAQHLVENRTLTKLHAKW